MNLARQLLKSPSTKIISNSGYTKFFFRNVNLQAHVSGDKSDILEVKFDEEVERFPLIWLRDNCLCDACYHSASSSRIINWNEFNINVAIKGIQAKSDNKLLIHWKDDHKSEYDWKWLQKRSFSKKGQERYLEEVFKPKRKLWGKEDFFYVLRKYNYEDVMNDKVQFCHWLEDLSVYGNVLISNAPLYVNLGEKLAEKIAFIKKTHYGAAFRITNKPGTQNVAYLSSLLQLHTDLPYYLYAPGVTILHYIVQTAQTGGENLLTDVFYVAEKLRRESPEIFKILTSTLVNWLDVGEEDGVKFNKIIRQPMIGLDMEGNLDFVRHSIPQRDSYFTTNIENVASWYKALRVFVDTVNQEAAKFKLEPGSILAFDNTRLVHGRLGYEDSDENHRLLIGLYVDWDEVYSALRVLKKELGLLS